MSPLQRARPSAVALAVAAILLTTAAVALADGPAFPSTGAFVLGDVTVAVANPADTVTWWSHSWWKENTLTFGASSASFKGFADTFFDRSGAPVSSPTCGDTWTTTPGNSPHPPATVPSGVMKVLVSSAITKSGNVISGDIVKIVIVATDDGYGPNPGHPGTGQIVETVCDGSGF